MKDKIKKALPLAIVALVSGCASMAISEDGIKTNTAQALGVYPNDVSISNRSDAGVKTSYIASANGKSYTCYMTGGFSPMGSYASDAICTPMASSAGSVSQPTKLAPKTNCNALLSAAGKC